MKVIEKYSGRDFKAYVSDKFEVILFEYERSDSVDVLLRIKYNHQYFDDKFIELYGSSNYSSGKESMYHLTNPFDDVNSNVEICVKGSLMFIKTQSFNFDFLKFDRDYDIKKFDITLLELPKRRILSSVYEVNDKYIIIDRPEFIGNDINIYYGVYGSCEKLEILEFVSYRDGGTQEISTNVGEIFIPTPFEKNLKPTFTDKSKVEKRMTKIGEKPHLLKLLLEDLNIKEFKSSKVLGYN